jgi:UDP-N-acetylglucosamine:LPS N-acetylglucosamine transferase
MIRILLVSCVSFLLAIGMGCTITPKSTPRDEKFEETLLKAVDDVQIANIVFRSFQTHLATLVDDNPKLKADVQAFIVKRFFKLGSPSYDLATPFEGYPKVQTAFRDFRQEIIDVSKREIALPFNNIGNPKKRITILTGPYGAGHISPAKALKEELQDEFEVTIIDDEDIICNDIRENNPLLELCQENDGLLLIKPAKYKDPELPKFLRDRSGLVRRRIAELKPDFIISALHHIPQLSSIAHYMNIPSAVVVTDFHFPEPQWEMIDEVKYPIFSYWIPTENPDFFRQMIQSFTKQGPAFDWAVHPRSKLIREKLFEAKKELRELLPELEVFKPTGFPVAKIFEQPASADEKNATYQKLKMNSDSNRKNVTLSSGGAVVSDTIKGFLEILFSRKELLNNKIQLVILTGRNKDLYRELESFLTERSIPLITDRNYSQTKNRKFKEKIIARVMPMLSYPTEIASLYKVTDLLLSKSGGATTAEIAATHTPYLRAFGLNQWELENVKYLESIGLTLPPKRFVKKEDSLKEDLEPYLSPMEQDEFFETLNKMLAKKPDLRRDKIFPFKRDAIRQSIRNAIEGHRRLNGVSNELL